VRRQNEPGSVDIEVLTGGERPVKHESARQTEGERGFFVVWARRKHNVLSWGEGASCKWGRGIFDAAVLVFLET